MDFSELDDIVENAPGSEIDVPFFEELRSNLTELLTLLNSPLPVYEDNEEALADGVEIGVLYATPTGEVRITVEEEEENGD